MDRHLGQMDFFATAAWWLALFQIRPNLLRRNQPATNPWASLAIQRREKAILGERYVVAAFAGATSTHMSFLTRKPSRVLHALTFVAILSACGSRGDRDDVAASSSELTPLVDTGGSLQVSPDGVHAIYQDGMTHDAVVVDMIADTRTTVGQAYPDGVSPDGRFFSYRDGLTSLFHVKSWDLTVPPLGAASLFPIPE